MPREPPAAEGARLCPKSDSLIALTIAQFTFGAAAQKNFLKLEINIIGLDNLKCFLKTGGRRSLAITLVPASGNEA